MKKWLFITAMLFTCNSNSADLMNVFENALKNDNVYQEAVLKAMSYHENIAIRRAYLLPDAQFDARPVVDRQLNYGAVEPTIQPPRNSLRSYEMRLSVSQPIFNFAIFSKYKASKINARAALASLNADLQDLILRVSRAYFNVLRSEKKVAYLRAYKKALARQLYDVKQRYKEGKTTRFYVDSAKSSYSLAKSDFIAAQDELASDKDALTELTAVDYTFLAELKEKIPLVSPQPVNVNRWVKKALTGNWSVQANQLKVLSAREKIKQNYSRHLPTINAKVLYDDDSYHYDKGSLIIAAGSSRTRNAAALLNVNVPIFSGGLVVAATRKAQYSLRIAQHKLDHSLRKTNSLIRSSYRNVISSIKKIRHESVAIQSAQSSLYGLRERYIHGSGNLIDVFDQQAKLLEAQMRYESARYDYIMNLLQLKKAAGTLGKQDLLAVSNWLNLKPKRASLAT